MIIAKHNGIIPTSLEDLMERPGVGRKSAILLRNECFGWFSGVGSDDHVFKGSIALGFLLQSPTGNQITLEHAKAALREWIRQADFTGINKIFSGIAQFFTQDFENVRSKEKKALA